MAKFTNMTGLDIQRDYICIAQYCPQDVSIRQLFIRPLAVESVAGTDEYWGAVAGELKAVNRKLRLGGLNVVCGLPCDMAVVKALEAQSEEHDQDEILRWELAANLMGDISRYTYDFYEISPGDQIERRRYLAAAARNEALAAIRKAAKGVKFNPYIIDIDLFALTNTYQSNYRDRMLEAAILVHGEYRYTTMVLVRNGAYVDYGVVNFNATAQSGMTGYAAMLGEEAARLVSANGLPPDGVEIFLTGSLFADKQFAGAVMGGVPRCEVLDPFRNLACAAGVDSEMAKIYAPQLAVSIGLALRGDEI